MHTALSVNHRAGTLGAFGCSIGSTEIGSYVEGQINLVCSLCQTYFHMFFSAQKPPLWFFTRLPKKATGIPREPSPREPECFHTRNTRVVEAWWICKTTLPLGSRCV